ncbi:uncharacterized protein [Miscanthus floridulus]|uniref:uncharacterized protein n=1 Tax=Miscanthus floridulus TaxID=154761 RepID=UPI00345855EB
MRTTDNTASNINVEGPMPYLNECDAMPDINETHHAMPDVNQTHNSTSDVNETQHVNTDAIEDADFLEAIMNRCADPSIFFMKRMEALKKAAEEPLYDESKGCTKEWSTLRAVLQFLTIKARYGWSDASFNDLLRILGDLLPKENKVPANMYYAKKLVSPLTMGVEKIHACRNHCILYRGDQYKDLDSCPNCGASRYKTNKDYREEENAASVSLGRKRKKTQTKTQQDKRSKPTSNIEVDYYALRRIPALVIWYLPVVDRLRCLFANPDDAELMTWHASDERKDDGKLRHPADAKQWQEFNKKYLDFAEDPRNVRAINPVFLKMAITRLCYFFNKISEKVIIGDELESLQKFAAETLSQLEMCFHPSFFDIMVHLIVHLVPQIEALGPMYFHEMWTYERFMSILNGYMSNRAHPEGSMIEAYTTEEAIESGGPLCNNLLKDQVSIGLPPLRHEGRLGGRGRMGRKSFIPLDYNIVLEVHYSILQQLIIMDPFTKQHMKELHEENPGCTNDWVHKEHKRRFTAWLKNLDMTDESETIKILASGPSSQVISWQSYDISGFTFSTSFGDTKRMAQNSGVRCEAVDETTGEETTYFGFIDDIWEVEYGPRL